jgi:hypothetical protein
LKGLYLGERGGRTYLGKRAIVPEITVMREAVPNVAKLTLLDILLNGIEELLFCDLQTELYSQPPMVPIRERNQLRIRHTDETLNLTPIEWNGLKQ